MYDMVGFSVCHGSWLLGSPVVLIVPLVPPFTFAYEYSLPAGFALEEAHMPPAPRASKASLLSIYLHLRRILLYDRDTVCISLFCLDEANVSD